MYCYKTKFVRTLNVINIKTLRSTVSPFYIHSTRMVIWHRLDMNCIKNYLWSPYVVSPTTCTHKFLQLSHLEAFGWVEITTHSSAQLPGLRSIKHFSCLIRLKARPLDGIMSTRLSVLSIEIRCTIKRIPIFQPVILQSVPFERSMT